METTFERALELLETADNILLLPHIKPDGDTLGSSFALKRALQRLGKKVYLLTEEPLTPRFETYSDQYYTDVPNEKIDFVVAIDTADSKLLGERKEKFPAIDLVIDHHPSNTHFAKETYVDVHAAATGEIIYRLIKAMPIVPEQFILDWIYIALITDTGCFRFGNTTSDTFRIAAELFDLGVDGPSFNRPFIMHKSKSRLIAEKLVMETLEFHLNDQVTTMVLTNEMREQTGISEDDVDGFAQIPKSIDGVKVGVFFKEETKTEWRLSIRTSIDISASEFAQKFDGGGHRQAAGCNLTGSLDEVKQKILSELQKMLK